MATTTAINNLDSVYTSLINYQIQVESQPLNRLTNQKTQLETQRAVYADLKAKLEQLRTATKALLSNDTFYALQAGRQISFTGIATGSTVMTGSVASTAAPASYSITDIVLAKNDRVRSDEQEYADQALGMTGTFYIGGAEDRSVTKRFENVTAFTSTAVELGQTILATGNYFVETQKVGEAWQFRLVDSNGAAVQIKNGETFSADWQAIPAGPDAFDTGRGLSVDFGTDAAKYIASSRNTGAAAVAFDADLASATMFQTVAATSVEAEVENGRKELGTGNYFVETRMSTNNVWQFRLVNDEGTAVSIKNGTTYSAEWQSIPTGGGEYSTGRGLSINFAADTDQYSASSKATGAFAIAYEAKGAAVDVTSTMSLIDIASAINLGTFGDGNELTATVVNRQLVINNTYTGLNHRLEASGSVLEDLGILNGSAFKNVMQSAGDASFSVNGLDVTRSQNSALTDVINGVTLNLASDAEGKSATLNITSDQTAAKNAITSFLANFNTLQTYLAGKSATTKQADGKYSRGALAGDLTLTSLRGDLFSKLSSYDATGGLYKSLRDIGIDVNSSMTAVVADSAKLDDALKNHFSDVTKLVDRVMTAMDTQLSKVTGTATAYVSQLITSNDKMFKSTNDQITLMNARLDQRKITLTNQYAEVQAQMTLLSYTQQTNTSWINGLYSTIYG
jgi:flagellar hook-associated protein 2